MHNHNDESLHRLLTTKLHLYEALYILNRGFEATMLGLKRLEALGILEAENLNAYKVRLELTRAEANEELAGAMQQQEENDSAYWDRLQHEWEKQRADPDDVFITARERKQEIKDQIRNLQAGLARQVPGRKKRRRS